MTLLMRMTITMMMLKMKSTTEKGEDCLVVDVMMN